MIGWFAEVSGELGDGMQAGADSGGRVMADLLIFQRPLSQGLQLNILSV